MSTLMLAIPQQTLGHLAMEPRTFAGTMKVITALQMDALGQLASRAAVTLPASPMGDFCSSSAPIKDLSA